MHDEKAFYSMGGVSGHAGLFSNTGDIRVNANDAERRGYGDVQLFSAETVKMFTTSSKEDATFGLGWRVNGNATMTPTFGTLASPNLRSHWLDRNGDRYRSGESYGDCDVKQQAAFAVADSEKNPNMFESGQLPIATYGWGS